LIAVAANAAEVVSAGVAAAGVVVALATAKERQDFAKPPVGVVDDYAGAVGRAVGGDAGAADGGDDAAAAAVSAVAMINSRLAVLDFDESCPDFGVGDSDADAMASGDVSADVVAAVAAKQLGAHCVD